MKFTTLPVELACPAGWPQGQRSWQAEAHITGKYRIRIKRQSRRSLTKSVLLDSQANKVWEIQNNVTENPK